MSTILIKGGTVIDPVNGTEKVEDILIRDGIIAKRKTSIKEKADKVINAKGLTVTPGIVDMHVHFRDPGQTYKEDIFTGALAAAHGGVTSVLTMPNTKPVMDEPDRISYVVNKGKSSAIHVYQVSAITKGMKGETLTDIAGVAKAGAKALSEDGKSVMNTKLLRDAMLEAKKAGIPVCSHCEDLALVDGGVMNDDENALRLGLPGINNASEDVIIARDMVLAKDTGCHLHLCHCSTAGSVDLIRAGKAMGVDLSAETCPHYLILTSDDIPGDDGNFKMNPPLRAPADREAIRKAVADDTIDILVTDHAPHARMEKAGGFKTAPFGIVGIETSVALLYTEMVRTGDISLMQMIRKMTVNPAKVMGIEAGTLDEGAPADVAIFDFENAYVIDPAEFLSKGKNTPFAGREVYGKTMYTICGGKVVWEENA